MTTTPSGETVRNKPDFRELTGSRDNADDARKLASEHAAMLVVLHLTGRYCVAVEKVPRKPVWHVYVESR
jgi:hypothetical protein